MNVTEIQKRLDAIAKVMTDKGIKMPRAQIHIHSTGERFAVHVDADYETNPFDGCNYHTIFGSTPEEALCLADEYIAALPDPEVAAKQNWHRKLAGVIDEGHALSLPDEVMSPLRTGSQAMTENLLTYEPRS